MSSGKRPPRAKTKTSAGKPRRSSSGWFGWAVALVVVGIACWLVSRPAPTRETGLQETNNPPIAFLAPTLTNQPEAASRPRAWTNSPLEDPSFKMPDDPLELVNYGTEFLERGWVNEAIILYRKAQEKNPEDEEVYFNLGCAY